jgi:hypothetical protein
MAFRAVRMAGVLAWFCPAYRVRSLRSTSQWRTAGWMAVRTMATRAKLGHSRGVIVLMWGSKIGLRQKPRR